MTRSREDARLSAARCALRAGGNIEIDTAVFPWLLWRNVPQLEELLGRSRGVRREIGHGCRWSRARKAEMEKADIRHGDCDGKALEGTVGRAAPPSDSRSGGIPDIVPRWR